MPSEAAEYLSTRLLPTAGATGVVTLWQFVFLKASAVTKLSPKIAQKEQKLRKSKNLKAELSCGWQWSLIRFYVR
jgi:hypothetical protein